MTDTSATTPKWQLTSVSDGQSGRGDWARDELRTLLVQGWEPFAVSGARIWLRQKVETVK